MTGTASVDSIRVKDRHRTDLGDVQALADSIADVGLIHPVVVDPDGRLVAGERRLAACRILGMDEVPVRVVRGLDDASALLRAERDENTCRKPMTASELYALGKALEELERPKAQERIKQAGREHGRGSNSPGSAEPGLSASPTAEAVGAGVGLSSASWKRLKHIGDRAKKGDEEAQQTMEQIDSGTKSLTGAYQGLRRKDIANASDAKPERRRVAATERAAQVRELAELGHRAEQIAERLNVNTSYVRKLAREHDISLPDVVLGKTRKHDANRIVAETIATLEGVALGVDLIEMDQLDCTQIEAWATSLSSSLASLKKLAKNLKEMAHDGAYQPT